MNFTKTTPTLAMANLAPVHAAGLLELFEALQDRRENTFFQPHPFTPEHVQRLCTQPREDVYCVAHVGPAVLAYGMLRGWDEGYAIPSLGIAVHPEYRGRGLAVALMAFLHAAAALRGSRRVRLRVHDGNERAILLYRRLGYTFDPKPDAAGLLVAYKALGA